MAGAIPAAGVIAGEEPLKVEAGESLILSWMRHVVGCQIVQLNWKPSVGRWTLYDEQMLESFLEEMKAHFRERRGRDIFNQGEPSQLIRQGEIDVLGLRLGEDGGLRLFAVDIANHFAGLNLGMRDRTIARVLKKLVRSAVSLHGYFPGTPTEVMFASPKVDHRTQEMLTECIADLNEALEGRSMPIRARLVCNEEFGAEIVQNVVECADTVADTSELFLRSIQLCHIAGIAPGERRQSARSGPRAAAGSDNAADEDGDRVGIHIQRQVQHLIDLGKIPQEEIIRLLDQGYSTRVFRQSYPVLKRHDPSLPKSMKQHHVNGAGRYYSRPYRIGDGHYYLCSQWVDRHRDHFDRWVAARLREEA